LQPSPIPRRKRNSSKLRREFAKEVNMLAKDHQMMARVRLRRGPIISTKIPPNRNMIAYEIWKAETMWE
jgi:hypothetical protein